MTQDNKNNHIFVGILINKKNKCHGGNKNRFCNLQSGIR